MISDVYGLVDPRDEKIYYVGSAVNPRKRLTQHLQLTGQNIKKDAWLRDLHSIQLVPSIRILERDVLSNNRNETEKRWIKQLIGEGMPLHNIASTARALNPYQRIAELEQEIAALKNQTEADAEDIVSYFEPKSKREIAIQMIERGVRLLKEAERE
jgi:hypothetical protein